MKYVKKEYFLIISILMLIFSCGVNNFSDSQQKNIYNSGSPQVKEYKGMFPNRIFNTGQAVTGGEPLKIVISATKEGFGGILSEAAASNIKDRLITRLIGSVIVDINEDFEFTNTGIIDEMSIVDDSKKQFKKVILKIKEGIKWSDGQPFTSEDIVYTYEVVAHKDYKGENHWGETGLGNIKGARNYYEKLNDTISGLRKIDDRTVELTLYKFPQGLNNVAGMSIIKFALPKHHLSGIPVKELPNSDRVRTNIVTLGPYVPTEIIQGLGFKAKANEYYFRGKPKIDKLVVDVISSKSMLDGIKNGVYDIALLEGGEGHPTYMKYSNIEILGNMSLSYTFLNFNLGHWDKEKNENVMKSEMKMSDKRLRQALRYALNIEERIKDKKAKRIYHYTYEKTDIPIPPIIRKYSNRNIEYTYEPEKAKRLLDEAGYIDINGDGFREDKNGNPLEINFFTHKKEDTINKKEYSSHDTIEGYIVSQWSKIGIKTKLIEVTNEEIKKIEDTNDTQADVYLRTREILDYFNPFEYFSRTGKYFGARFVSEEHEEILRETVSEQAMYDQAYKIMAYNRWQEYFGEQVAEIPLYNYQKMVLVNKRVKNFYIFTDERKNSLYFTELTATVPYTSK
ncbi:MAG: ABC transporter substrate-binding protein [Leptotrichiaceae bacterium]|nr:ABC transporter substrate-binding protein [Leptotrichiaceae bacterium]